ncbi:MAG: hypothetical protein ABIP74_00160 [Candidatus Saccharimonas sp.]
MQEQEAIISVKEFRKFAGKEAERFSDDEVLELINQLDILAQLYINSRKTSTDGK